MRDEVITLLTKALLKENTYLNMASAKYQAQVMISEVELEAQKRTN